LVADRDLGEGGVGTELPFTDLKGVRLVCEGDEVGSFWW
jgi:hypothetical protein